MVILLSLLSLLGVLIVPLAKRCGQAYEYINLFLVALGTSALLSDAILHLIPGVSQLPTLHLIPGTLWETSIIWSLNGVCKTLMSVIYHTCFTLEDSGWCVKFKTSKTTTSLVGPLGHVLSYLTSLIRPLESIFFWPVASPYLHENSVTLQVCPIRLLPDLLEHMIRSWSHNYDPFSH